MAGVDIAIVREYFELNGFLVRQLRKHHVQKRSKKHKGEEEIDLVVLNPKARKRGEAPDFILFSSELPKIHRAIVSVRGWHTARFTPATLRNSSEIFNFLEKDVIDTAEELFAVSEADRKAYGSLRKILVVPGLPTQEPHRSQSVELLREHGVDAILSFRSVLQDIISKVEVNHNYERNDVLQTLRILKNYDMIQPPQMELFGSKRSR